MEKKIWVAVAIVLALISTSCQLFVPASSQGEVVSSNTTDAPTSNPDGVVSANPAVVFADQPDFDLQAPPPSPGAAALRVLAGWDPGVAELQSDVEVGERAVLAAFS